MKIALIFALMAMLLQTVVFIQPLLPERFQIALVCATISEAFSQKPNTAVNSTIIVHQSSQHQHANISHQNDLDHVAQMQQLSGTGHKHDTSHQCLYCKVFANLTTGLTFTVDEVVDRIYVRMLAFEQKFQHIYFTLQRLYLLPQGRAPPFFS